MCTYTNAAPSFHWSSVGLFIYTLMLHILVLLVFFRFRFNCNQMMTCFMQRKRPYVYIHVMSLFKYLVQQPERWKIFFHLFLDSFKADDQFIYFFRCSRLLYLFSLHFNKSVQFGPASIPRCGLEAASCFHRCISPFLTFRNHLDQHVCVRRYPFSHDLAIHRVNLSLKQRSNCSKLHVPRFLQVCTGFERSPLIQRQGGGNRKCNFWMNLFYF